MTKMKWNEDDPRDESWDDNLLELDEDGEPIEHDDDVVAQGIKDALSEHEAAALNAAAAEEEEEEISHDG